MTKVFRYALATALWGAALGGCCGTANAVITLSTTKGTVTAVNPTAHTVDIGHKRCQVAANASGGAGMSGRMQLNAIQPGTTVRYGVVSGQQHGCTIRLLQPAKPAHQR